MTHLLGFSPAAIEWVEKLTSQLVTILSDRVLGKVEAQPVRIGVPPNKRRISFRWVQSDPPPPAVWATVEFSVAISGSLVSVGTRKWAMGEASPFEVAQAIQNVWNQELRRLRPVREVEDDEPEEEETHWDTHDGRELLVEDLREQEAKNKTVSFRNAKDGILVSMRVKNDKQLNQLLEAWTRILGGAPRPS